MSTPRYITINHGKATIGEAAPVALTAAAPPEDWYRHWAFSYPKFFKMDVLSKWAWLGAEALLKNADNSWRYDGLDKSKIAVMLATGSGCLDVDKRYRDSMESIASPALFVYTLPNIMLGEICIRHGFKGEQLCLVQEHFDAAALHLWAADGLRNRGLDACLCGWIDAHDSNCEVTLFWLTKNDIDVSAETLQTLFNLRLPAES